MWSKKPRVSIVKNKNGVHPNDVKKGPCTFTSSKSSIPLPSKPVRVSVVGNKYPTASILKRYSMMSSADRILDKAYVRQYKVGKLVLTD
ncbi:hypothetical protein SESBI_17667 [Sesbania bispinosa]|nr:hypothetical protein SESBI_17667 [Sesbania bispinosa]